jgi:hypothetical protein
MWKGVVATAHVYVITYSRGHLFISLLTVTLFCSIVNMVPVIYYTDFPFFIKQCISGFNRGVY